YGSIGTSVSVSIGAVGAANSGIGNNAGNSGSGGPSSQGSLLRLDEPRIYSSSALQLGSNAPSNIQRSNSPQHFIDRSISLIRLDNSSNNNGGAPPSNISEASGGAIGSSGINSGSSQPRLDRFKIKFTADLANQQQQSNLSSNLTKTLVELGSSSDPLAGVSGAKPKYKPPIIEVPPKPPVETSDKAVMTSQLPEQWSLVSSGSEGRRISIGATSPLGNSPTPAPTLAGGVPDLLPSCVVRQNDYAVNP
ncbi:unnamed protein product, partial [Allacma fusca]